MKTLPIHGLDFSVLDGFTMYAHEPCYEHYLFGHVMPRLGPRTTFLDVGANIGVFAIHAAHKGAQAIAVEPRPSNCILMLETARRLGLKIELHPLAVSDHHGYAVLDLAADSENAALGNHEPGSANPIVALGVLDDLIGGRWIDVLKIDVEGHEYRAMQGARRLLERCRPVIFTEYHPAYEQAGSGVNGETYLRFLMDFGYRMHAIHRTGAMEPIENPTAVDAECHRLGYHLDLCFEP